MLLALGEYLRREHKEIYGLYKYFFIVYPLFTLYYWLHLFLADSLAFLFFSCSFWLILSQTYSEKFSYKTLLIASLSVWALIFSSMTYLYVGIMLYAWIGYLAWKKDGVKMVFQIGIISAIPYLAYALFLLLTGTFHDFWVSNFVYNTKLYISIPNYTRGEHFNPLKFMLTLIFNFYQGWIKQLTFIKSLDIYFPVATMMACSTFVMLWLLFVKNRILFVLYFFLLSFSAPRSNVSSLSEANYQAGVYMALGLISTFIVLWKMKDVRFKHESLEIGRKVAGFLVMLFFSFSIFFLIKNVYDKSFQRYTQALPGIYELPDVKNFSHEIISPNDTVWIGPYIPQEMFYFDVSQLPGKYISLLPQMSEDQYFSQSFIQQFNENPPAMIIYKHDESIFGNPADKFGSFFLEWMSTRYQTIDSLEAYSIQKSPTAFNVGGDLYMRNDIFEKSVTTLESKGYIRPLSE